PATAAIYPLSLHDALPIFAPYLHLGLNPFGRELLHVPLVALQNVVRILIGHQAHGNLGLGSGWNHRLRARRGEATGHAVHLERGDRKSTRLNSSHVSISYA